MLHRPMDSVIPLCLFTLVLLLTSIGSAAAQNSTPTVGDGGTPSAAGIVESMVSVDGRSLHLACAGTGTPTVVFEQGGPTSAAGTSLITALGPDLAAALGTRFCAYDRAGTGQSDADPVGVRTFTEAATDLQAVLASPELACPCVVIGESLGGSIALVALSADASNFAGLVLLDTNYPGSFDEFLALAPAGSPEAALADDPNLNGANEEQLDLAVGFSQVTAPAQPPGIPVVVVTHGAGFPPPCNWEPPCSADYPVAEFEAAWQAGQSALAAALGGRLIVAEGIGHAIATENPELVVGLVAEVVAAVRDPSSWATPAP